MNFIYLTTNLLNGKQYVGSHEGNIDDNYFGSGSLIKKSLSKNGKLNFHKVLLEECDPSMNLILEEKYIQKYNTLVPEGYNISPTGGHGLRGKLSAETIEKIKRKNTGLKRTDKVKKKISKAKKGKPLKNRGVSWKNIFIKKYGETEGLEKYGDFIENQKMTHMRNTSMKGKKLSMEWRKNISEGHKGIKQSKETIEKRRLKQIGRKHREDTKTKMSNSHKGKIKSKLHVENMKKSLRKIFVETGIINEIKDLKNKKISNTRIHEKYSEYSLTTIGRIINGKFDMGYYKK